MTDSIDLRLVGREDCPLCEELEQALRLHPDFAGHSLVHVDADANPDVLRRYGLRIPVLLDAWNEVICEGHFDDEAFAAWCEERRRAGLR